jgi:TonB-dependent SusC/RagA subfamily outer membrane receptor
MRVFSVLLIILPVIGINNTSAQKSHNKATVSGTVLDANNKPIVNAIIMINGIKTQTLTNDKGKYWIRVDTSGSKIGIFTFGSGIFEQEIRGRDRIDFNFSISSDQRKVDRYTGLVLSNTKRDTSGNELVDVGYGYVKKKNLSFDVGYINGRDKKYASFHSVYDMILFEISGVSVKMNHITGERTIIIHEASNILRQVPPLIIVDGAPVENNYLDIIAPSTVESISVLKGTAASIYGSRGYGGAIIIHTRYN